MYIHSRVVQLLFKHPLLPSRYLIRIRPLLCKQMKQCVRNIHFKMSFNGRYYNVRLLDPTITKYFRLRNFTVIFFPNIIFSCYTRNGRMLKNQYRHSSTPVYEGISSRTEVCLKTVLSLSVFLTLM